MALESGSRLGPYEVVGLLGSGGMGEVYRARDARLEREVAIKVLPEEIADHKRLRRFEQEARAAGALNHPNVLAVYDIGTHDGAPYVVSELLEGQTLRVRLEGGALPVRKALDHALQVVHGLAAAHDKGIVHRDLKPENVFVTEDDRVKILDFGLAKLTRRGPLAGEDEGTATKATEPGTVMGTVGYMSPEQVRGEAVDHRSDIFSFGAVLFEMLSGRRAFRGASAAETMNAILKQDPPELSEPGGAISPGLARIVYRCLEKRAGNRFHSAHDLALALEAASSGLSGPASLEDSGSDGALVVSVAKRHKKALLTALAAIVLLAGGVYWGLVRSPPPPPGDVIDSVAVLPFENVGGDPDSEYLSDGVAESLINKLSQLPNLRVIARSTTFRFRGSDVDPQQVGHDLEVGAVLTGRVSQRGDTLVISAELLHVAQGTQLWGERYSTGMGDIFAVEEDIAGEISRGLRLKLAPRNETLLAKRHTENSEAYRLYLLSRYELNKDTREGARKAREYAQQATVQDPTYAPAYVALAESYYSLGGGGRLPYREAYSRAKTAATKALEIDETLPEGHTVLARAVLNLDWDWAGAERGFKRALELNPNSADAHSGYGSYLARAGLSRQGIAHYRRALELDPLTPWRHADLSMAYYQDRQFDQTLGPLREATELDPTYAPLLLLAWIHREKGMYEEAIAEFLKLADGGSHPAHILGHLGNTYARAGRVREARECLRELKERLEEDTIGLFEVALIYAGLGEKDQAFEWLDKAYEERDKGLMYLKAEPALDPLRSDPRFQDLLRRMNFPS
jgi:serine/threonine protein kinase/tetratricopeptide (TPR) repeat protein